MAILAAVWPLFMRGLEPGHLASRNIDPALALVWVIGTTCAVGGALLAKFNWLTALILIGGAGLASCMVIGMRPIQLPSARINIDVLYSSRQASSISAPAS